MWDLRALFTQMSQKMTVWYLVEAIWVQSAGRQVSREAALTSIHEEQDGGQASDDSVVSPAPSTNTEHQCNSVVSARSSLWYIFSFHFENDKRTHLALAVLAKQLLKSPFTSLMDANNKH